MKRLIRGILSDATYHASRLANGTSGGLRILMYHRVTDAHPHERLCVPVAQWEAQMRDLRDEGYRSLSLADAVRWIERGGALPPKSVVITFDDGYVDNFHYAAATMARYGLTGMFFIPTARLDGPTRGSHPDDASMSWAQLAELLAQGHEIGAHSVTHRKLTLIDPAQRAREVRECKQALEQRLQRSVEFFCYPAGAYDGLVKQAVRDSGYRGACTVEPGANRPWMDVFALKRTEISAVDSLWDVRKKLAGAYDWLHVAAQAVYRMSPRSRQQPSNALMGDADV